MPRTRLLLSNADSLTGSHILRLLLSEGSLSVRAIVESREKAIAIQDQYRRDFAATVDLTVIPDKDLAVPGAFDDALNDEADPFSTVIHALSAHSSDEADCLARFIHLESETLIDFLRSVQQHAKQVRRVVIVASLTPFAQWLQVERHSGRTTGGNRSLVTTDPESILTTSQAGDNIVYEKVQKWVSDFRPQFDVVYITAPSCYGPALQPLETSSDLLEANRRIWNICSNERRERIETPPFGISHFLDVRDLALATFRAIFATSAGNKRFLISAGAMPSTSEIAEILVAYYPELRGRIRMDGSPPLQRHSEDPSLDFLSMQMATVILGISEYRSAEITLADTARQIIDLQRRKEWRRIIQS